MVRVNTTILIVIIVLVILTNQAAMAQEPLREIIINIPAFRLYLYENGVPIREYPIGVGNVFQPSIIGETRIINKVVDPTYYPTRWWERGLEPIPPGPDNPVGTRWLGLGFPSYGIHGTNNPDSIGQAMSSGCIRMYNHDVEELTNLVSIGTPVYLIYETITLERDPLFGTRLITLYPDVYRLDIDYIAQAKKWFSAFNWNDVHLPVLESIVASKHTGKSQILPIAVDLYVNDQKLSQTAVKMGKTYYVHLEAVLGSADNYQYYRDWRYWDAAYVNLVELANTYGFGYQIAEAIDIFSVDIYLADQMVDVSSFLLDNQLYFPVDELSKQLGLPVGSYLDDVTIKIGNKRYISYDACSIWGFTVDWEYPGRKGKILIPQAYLDGMNLGISFLGTGNEMYVQLNPILDFMDIKVDWFHDLGIEYLSVGELIYVPDWVIRWLMPGADLTIVYPKV